MYMFQMIEMQMLKSFKQMGIVEMTKILHKKG
jgi:hypothetical protein